MPIWQQFQIIFNFPNHKVMSNGLSSSNLSLGLSNKMAKEFLVLAWPGEELSSRKVSTFCVFTRIELSQTEKQRVDLLWYIIDLST